LRNCMSDIFWVELIKSVASAAGDVYN
jgi:hypothetical protein